MGYNKTGNKIITNILVLKGKYKFVKKIVILFNSKHLYIYNQRHIGFQYDQNFYRKL